MKAFSPKSGFEICGNCQKWDKLYYDNLGICRFKRYFKKEKIKTTRDQLCDIDLEEVTCPKEDQG